MIIIFFFIGLAPLIVFSVAIYNLGYNTLVESAGKDLTNQIYQKSHDIEQINELRIQQLQTFSSNNEIQELFHTNSNNIGTNDNMNINDAIKNEWKKLQVVTGGKDGFKDLIIINKKGTVIFSDNESLVGKDLSDNRLFMNGLEKPGSIIDITSGETRIETVVPVIDYTNASSNILGVIMAYANSNSINKVLLDGNNINYTSESYLVNSDGVLLTPPRYVDNTNMKKIDTFPVRECFEYGTSLVNQYKQLVTKSSLGYSFDKGTFGYENYNNTPVFGASICEKDLGYVLVVETAQQLVLTPIDQFLFYIIITISVIVIIIVIAIIGSVVYLTRPLTQLKNAVSDIISGNFDTKIRISSTDEVGILARQFDTMRNHVKFVNKNLQTLVEQKTSHLENANKELLENQIKINQHLKEIAEVKLALDEASIYNLTDTNGTIIDVNQKFCDISKYSKEELIGQNHRILKSGYHTTEFYKELWDTITNGKIWKGEIKNRAKDGTHFWVKTTIIPFFDQQGRPIEYAAVRTDITSQKKIEDELTDLVKDLQEVDKQKGEFISMISHELRTPLVPILGYCEMLMDPSISGDMKESQLESIREIYKNSKTLQKLIEDILIAQKIDLNQLKYDKKEIHTISFMREVEETYKVIMMEKAIEFVNTTNKDEVIKSDPNRIMQIFGNLLLNAVDFTPEHGKIEIGAESKDEEIVFHVKDNGWGIPVEKQQKLFTKFYQVDSGIKRKHGGSGLGLSICKGIVDGLGGRMWLHSEHGVGSVFYFTVPKDKG